VPNGTTNVTTRSVLNDLSTEVTAENMVCSTCNTTSDHTQTANILNVRDYLYFPVQLRSTINTNVTNHRINALPSATLKIDDKYYSLNSAIRHHGQSMTEAHYAPVITVKKTINGLDKSVHFER